MHCSVSNRLWGWLSDNTACERSPQFRGQTRLLSLEHRNWILQISAWNVKRKQRVAHNLNHSHMILLCNNKSTTGANRAAVGFRGDLFVRDADNPMFPPENVVVISVCHLASTLGEAWRYVTPLMDTWTGGTSPAELLKGSTHLVSINWPAPWLRRVVDPI